MKPPNAQTYLMPKQNTAWGQRVLFRPKKISILRISPNTGRVFAFYPIAIQHYPAISGGGPYRDVHIHNTVIHILPSPSINSTMDCTSSISQQQ